MLTAAHVGSGLLGVYILSTTGQMQVRKHHMIVTVVAENGCEGDLHAMSSREAAVKLRHSTGGLIMGEFNVPGQPREVWVVAGGDQDVYSVITHVCVVQEAANRLCESCRQREPRLGWIVEHLIIDA